MKKIQCALISCTDKTGLVELSRFLVAQGIKILSTGGTAKLLRDEKIAVTEVSDFTGSPEILDGRVKTLHPKIHGGLLGIRDNADHQKQMEKNGIVPIDLVIVNLYAFEKTIADPKCTLEHAIENIDIGGPSLLRSAAKNHRDVTVVTDPGDYAELQKQIAATGGTSDEFRFRLATTVFQKTSSYDAAIAEYLVGAAPRGRPFGSGQPQGVAPTQICPDFFSISLTKIQDLRYGENPHQKAAFYRDQNATHGLVNAKQLHGKELSFNNILDMEAAYGACQEFQEPACVIIKHANPCGTATGSTLRDAFLRAKSGDPVSAFGGIVALNRSVDKETALALSEIFFEVILAPDYDPAALETLKAKKNLRLLVLKDFTSRGLISAGGGPASGWHQTRDLDYRHVSGGFLVQDRDEGRIDLTTCAALTKIKPTKTQLDDLAFAWKVVKHVKSNAIVFARDSQTLGVGAGQMSRVDSVRIATMKAREIFQNQEVLKGSVMASDAFFPFRDGVDLAIQAGVAAIVQPGGSVRDEEVIKACDEAGVAMIFTGMRHFRH